ncbi:beta-lactamase family protein [Actinospica durhamensis]|uniref:Beta-lactamase family protein n=1 Tax=Actinospica durhamensis TaxID=1508375 RepID=A0A941EJY4_9ACTN|nr:serine hydrolase domain-containing protein [Actinospica durhamensis]MBR7833870.1 beta-lactamase family protein [Actinospica durhamensis]
MTSLDDLIPELQALIDTEREEQLIPAVVLAVSRGDETIELASGVLNLDTGVEATADSLFQLGSITKPYTATLVMQLVDEGLVDLDAPVVRYVPEFAVSDEAATQTITVRQLLCHTGGFDGDVFDDFGRGDDAVARYVEALAGRNQLFPPGALFSYCNAGYSVLGRLVERVRDLPSWHVALRRHLLEPLGLTHTVSLPEEALLRRTAVGHMPDPDAAEDDKTQHVTKVWHLPMSTAPVGATLSASARDAVAFARMHMREGLAPDGTRVLSAESVAEMVREQVTLPALDDRPPNGWGLGWRTFSYAGPHKVFGHEGDTIGQSALLRYVPDLDLAFAVLTNGGDPYKLLFEAAALLLGRLADAEVPRPPQPPQTPVEIDHRRFLGRYETVAGFFEIGEAEDGGLEVRTGNLGPLAEQFGEDLRTRRLVGFSPTVLIVAEPEGGLYQRFSFPEVDDEGRASYLGAGVRVALRA